MKPDVCAVRWRSAIAVPMLVLVALSAQLGGCSRSSGSPGQAVEPEVARTTGAVIAAGPAAKSAARPRPATSTKSGTGGRPPRAPATSAIPARQPEGAPAPAPSAPTAGPSAAPAELGAEALVLYRVAACAGDAPLPAGLRPAVVQRHCSAMKTMMDRYRKRYIEVMMPFIAKVLPEERAQVVVYPFGGGDLLSALTTFGDAAELTTLSLEQVGDPRRLRVLDSARWDAALKLLRETIGGLLTLADSTSVNLMKMQQGDVPGQLAFFIVALATHGYQPVGLRYFQIAPDGSLRYLTEQDLAALSDDRARRLSGSWTTPDFSKAFANAELRFRRPSDGDNRVRVHRHIGANLADHRFKPGSAVHRHLTSKGRVAAMTKAASYLLWRDGFRNIRDYLIDHASFMISDSTGLSPLHARRAGLQFTTYGRFKGAFFLKRAENEHSRALREIFAKQPYRRLPYRFGYPDVAGRPHLMVVRKGSAQP